MARRLNNERKSWLQTGAAYHPADPQEAARHDSWQDWMIWLLRRRKPLPGEATSSLSDFPAESVSLVQTTPQTIPSGANTEMEFDSEAWDTQGYGDIANNSILIPGDFEGMYVITFSWSWDEPGKGDAASGMILLDSVDIGERFLAKLSHPELFRVGPGSGTGSDKTGNIATFFPLYEGDRIYGILAHDNVDDDDLDTAPDDGLCELKCVWVGPYEGDPPV